MINATTDFFKELNKSANKPIFLYVIYDYDGASTNLYLAEWNENVTFDGQEYVAFPITHDTVSENASGEIDSLQVKVSNVSRLIQSYLEVYDLRNKKVMIRLVWKDRLSYPDDKLDFNYFIDSYTASSTVVDFTLLPKTDLLGSMLPARTYSRNYCQWKFKSTECGYSGSETSCGKTKARCKELSNYVRFGGFPSIPTRQISVV